MARPAKIKDIDRGYRRIVREIGNSGKEHVAVGIYGQKAMADNNNTPNILIAVVHEFGTEKVPQRSYLRRTVDEKKRQIGVITRNLADSVLVGRRTTSQALEVLGATIQGFIRKRISARIPPPLSPITIARKGSSVPLIDTGQLRASIDFEVRSGRTSK